MTRWSLRFPLVLKDPAKSAEDKQTENPSPCSKTLSVPRKADNLNRQDRLGWEKGCVISLSQMGNRGTGRLSDLHKVCVRARNGSQISWILCHYLNKKIIFFIIIIFFFFSYHSLEMERPVHKIVPMLTEQSHKWWKSYTSSVHLVFQFVFFSQTDCSFLQLSFYPPFPLSSLSVAKDIDVNYNRRKHHCLIAGHKNSIFRPSNFSKYNWVCKHKQRKRMFEICLF